MMNKNMAQGFNKSMLTISCIAALGLVPSLQAADFTGTVTDQSHSVKFEGARVEIVELGLKAVTARDGTFRFSDIADGRYTLEITYLGMPKQQFTLAIRNNEHTTATYKIGASDELEEVVAFGQRSAQADAINRQKNAKSLKSIVSADSIGQFPDQNAAEALQRLPGMFIQRDQGEGRFVGIRGIDPNLNNVTINGANIPSPEAGVRSVAMDVIPSELIQGLEVSKTVTPDMDADAIGGSVEVKSLSAFDRTGQTFSVTAQASYSDLEQAASPKLSGSYTNIFDLSAGKQLGVATAISYFKREFGSDNVETDGGWMDIELEDANSGEDIEFFSAEEIEQRDYQITRERLGLALNLDLITSVTSQYYLRTLFSEFSDDEFRQRNEFKFEDGVHSQHDNSSLSVVDAEMDRDTKDRYEEQSILSTVIGGENRINDWLVEYNLGYSKSQEREPDRIDVAFAGEGLTMSYLSTGPIPQLILTSADMSQFELDEIETNDNLTEDKELSLKLDISTEIALFGGQGQVKFGAKHRDREKFNRVDVRIYDGGFGDASAANFSTTPPDWHLGNFGPGLHRGNITQFVRSNLSQFELNQNDSSVASQGESYISEETISAVYGMLDLDFDNWNLVAGLRYESTDFATNGNRVTLDVNEDTESNTVNAQNWQVDKDYDHLLPSVNLRYDISDQLVMRLAYSNTLSRPKFSDSAAFQIIELETEDGETERKAEVGNPDLDPYESANYDFSIEYYPGHIGVLSAGLFHKDIDNFIIQREVQNNGAWPGFEEVIQAVNGDSASVTGIELAWNKSFDSGLLLATNATFTDASDELPSQSDKIANFTVGYETDTLSARLSTSYKSEAFLFEDADRQVFEDTHTQVDLNVKYYVNDQSFIYFNAVNLTDEGYYRYHGSSKYNYQYEEYGRTFEIGFTYNAF